MSRFPWGLVFIFVCVFAFTAYAQDTRHVSEPSIPSSCVVLKAELRGNQGRLSERDEQREDTRRIQQAIDSCPRGKAVELRANGEKNIFLSGPLQLKKGVTLLVDANTAIFASRNPRDYDITLGSCGIVSEKGHGCRPLIAVNNAPDSGVMGDGSIDGRGGEKLMGQNETWWDLAHRAKIEDKGQSCFRLIEVNHSDNFTLYRITLRNSPNFHVAVNQTNGFTAWGVKILTPKTARNTDGIDPGSSTNVTIAYSWIHTGDDNVAIKSGKAGAASNISILHNHFYTGHGMSIGSGTEGGVHHILVQDLTIDGADNGIRIKSDRSRGGLVQNVTYEDVCIRDTRNPIIFTPLYTTFSGNALPVYRDILLKNVHVLNPGTYTFLGLDAQNKLGVTLDNVFADGQEQSKMIAKDAEITLRNHGNLVPGGEDVSVTDSDTNKGKPIPCEGRFVPFPEIRTAPEAANTVLPEDKTFYVAADGTGDYYSIQKALDEVPATGGATILVAPGTYREVLHVDKPGIRLRSANPDASKTVVVYDLSAGTSGGTLHSATVNVTANDFFAENITFQNDWNRTHPQLPAGSQALALLVTGDRAVFHNVHLLGNQDTLYTASHCPSGGTVCMPTRQYFSDCYIAGNVDFIFGDGKSFFDHCEIHSTPHSEGFVTAQGKHETNEDSAYVFSQCRLTADPGVANVYLGRPWRPYATVIFLNTWMGEHIQPAGWREWHPGETHSLDTAFYAEYQSTGPGAHTKERDPHTKFLTGAEAGKYTIHSFMSGNDHWDPAAVITKNKLE
jgi:polygalacturonase